MTAAGLCAKHLWKGSTSFMFDSIEEPQLRRLIWSTDHGTSYNWSMIPQTCSQGLPRPTCVRPSKQDGRFQKSKSSLQRSRFSKLAQRCPQSFEHLVCFWIHQVQLKDVTGLRTWFVNYSHAQPLEIIRNMSRVLVHDLESSVSWHVLWQAHSRLCWLYWTTGHLKRAFRTNLTPSGSWTAGWTRMALSLLPRTMNAVRKTWKYCTAYNLLFFIWAELCYVLGMGSQQGRSHPRNAWSRNATRPE